MSTWVDESSRSNERSNAESKSLAGRIIVMFCIPIVVQLLLTTALFTLRTSADSYAFDLGTAREASMAVRTVVSRSATIMALAEESLRSNLTTDYDCEKELAQIKVWSDWLAQFSGSTEAAQLAVSINDRTEKIVQLVHRATMTNKLELHRAMRMNQAPQLAYTRQQLAPAITSLDNQVENDLQKLQALQKHFIEQKLKLEQSKQQSTLFTGVIVGVVINLAALTGLGLAFSKEIIARLAVVQETVVRMKRRSKLLTELPGSDEIAQLDRSFHDMASMLDQVEAKEKTFFENAYNVLCSIDSERRILEVNQAATRVFGFRPEELIGKTVEMFVDPIDRTRVMNLLQQAISGEPQANFELTMLRRDGTPLETLWTTSSTGKQDKLFCVVHDVSERKAAQHLRREMVQTVTHDLRSPLTSLKFIYAGLRTSQFGQLNDKGIRLLNTAETNADRMLRLIDDLLDIENLEDGMVELTKSPTNLSTLLDQSVDSVLFLANQKQIIVSNMSSGANLIANVDPHRLVQVLVNLLSNAIKFSPSGGNIKVGLVTQTQGFVEIKVADQGRGIPANLLKDVFNRFQQVQRGDATEKGGSGLGLAISKSLIELHGGDLSVQSTLGEGSTFTIRLPIH